MIKTVTTTEGVNIINFGNTDDRYYWCKNIGETTLYVSAKEDISPDADDVAILESGDIVMIETYNQDIYVFGAGKIQIYETETNNCPFKVGGKGGGADVGGESSYTLKNAVDYPLLGLNLYGKSVQDGVPTPENPVEIVSVGDSGSVSVQACGKNLFEGSQDFSGEWVNANIWYTSNEKYNGLTVKYSTFTWNGIGQEFILNINTPYTVSFYAKTAKGQTLRAILATNPNGADYNTFNKEFTVTEEWERYTQTFICEEKSDVFIRVGAEASVTTPLYVCGFKLEFGDTTTDYEPYKGTTANITSALPLCGIPVSEGGNYTDINGQQWICDELIYNADGTGKIIKRTVSYTITENNSVFFIKNTGNYQRAVMQCAVDDDGNVIAPKEGVAICSAYRYDTDFRFSTTSTNIDAYAGCFALTNGGANNTNIRFVTTATTSEQFIAENLGVKIIYQRETAKEIELTSVEMSALRQLQTFNGITNISNDGGADMSVKYCTNKTLSEYVMPITTGLQAQIDELKTAVLSLGGNV